MPVIGRRPARARDRGASTFVVAGVSAWLCVAGYAGIGVTAVLSSDERAQTLADGAAHAAVGELMGDAAHDDVAALVQADAGSCWWEAPWLTPPGGAHLDGRCAPALAAAQAVVARTAAARLLSLVIVAEPLDDNAGASAPTRLRALAAAAVARGIQLPASGCDRNPGTRQDLCFAVAESAAEET